MSLLRLPQGELSDALVALRRVFTVIGGFSLAINLLLLTPSLYMLQTYDRVLTSRNEGTLLVLTLLLFGLLALEASLEFIRSQVLARVAAALDLQLDGRVFDAMVNTALRGQARGAQILGDLTHIRQFIAGKGLLAFFDIPWLPIYLLVVFLLNPWLGLFGLISAIILIGLAAYNEHAIGELLVQSGKLASLASQAADGSVRNAELIDALGMRGAMRRRWLSIQNEYLGAQGEANERGARIGGIVRFARTALQSVILGLGAYLVLQNQLTPGGMIAASILLGRALAPVDLAIAHWRGVVAAREAFARLNELLRAHPATKSLVTLPRPDGRVQVEHLVVAAPGKRDPILKGISFEVNPGQAIAIIGPSAAGKSTLARALVGVWTPLSGSVRLDGAEVATWEREDLGPALGYLPQDIELFPGSIAENIARFGLLDSTQVVEAARRAGVHELILHLPQGYETRIGTSDPASIVLSGGQRQRIALARALYGDPVLVVLDEPNANLDEAGDAALINALRDLKARKRTVFIVTHRANLLTQTDAILVLTDGRIQTIGPSADIIQASRRVAGLGETIPGETQL
ncbi:MAG: type I secretion system permease/ATPase [Rhodoferax sp.]|jgi:ATP-binding cassette subfamily C exporter for protease/lipase|nr:type I secretion system permease/ATPase [Rhodoferax sp.]